MQSAAEKFGKPTGEVTWAEHLRRTDGAWEDGESKGIRLPKPPSARNQPQPGSSGSIVPAWLQAPAARPDNRLMQGQEKPVMEWLEWAA